MYDDLYLDYASGSQSPGLALLTATHLAMRPGARRCADTLEVAGAMLFERLPASPLRAGALDDVLAQLAGADEAPGRAPDAPVAPENDPGARLPGPLAAVVGGSLQDLPWRRVMPGMAEVRLDAVCTPREDVKLVRFQAGRTMIRHGHAGHETTLILCGAYEDEAGRYNAGDVTACDDAVEHQPRVVSEEDCICLTVMEGGVTVRRPLVAFIKYFLQ